MTFAAGLWFAKPALGAWPLMIGLLPWAARIAVGRPPFRRTGLELCLAIFLVTAGVGVWAAYDTDAAWAKFWVLVSAVLYFYALVGQPIENLWLVVGFFGLVGLGVAAFFQLTHDWTAQEVKFEAIRQLGERWMEVRPESSAGAIGPNGAAGFMAMTVPLLGASAIRQARGRRVLVALGLTAATLLVLLALAGTSSRGAWIALAGGLAAWGVWSVTGSIAARSRLRHSTAFFSTLLLLALSLVVMAALTPRLPLELLQNLPGPPSAGSRLELARETLDLIGDVPFTGGGLQSFPGLYSQYIRNIPHLLIEYSHNLYLNLVIEQGLFGMGAFGLVLVAALVALAALPITPRNADTLLRGGLLAGAVVMLLHGLVTDVLYGLQGTPLLFMFPALAIAAARPMADTTAQVAQSQRVEADLQQRLGRLSGAALLFAVFATSVSGAWLANLGAVEMAKVELIEWPTGEWDDGSRVEELEDAGRLLMRALAFDPTNRTANHRLGLIRMVERDYRESIAYLEVAHAQDPDHRGIRKALGQSYAWAGQLDRAFVLLEPLPESAGEMGVYAWWWGTEGRDDLSAHAATLARLLGDASSHSK